MATFATIDWHALWHYAWPPTAFTDPLIVQGLLVTLYVAITAQFLGIVFGIIGALAQLSPRRSLRLLARLYVTYFRGTPLLVQLSLLYFGFAGLGIYSFPDSSVVGLDIPGAVQAGIIALGVNKGAYMTEIVRAGILSIDRGQTEAAMAIGMTRRQTMRRVVLPQAARVIVPPTGNEFNGIIKDSALLVTIGVVETFHAFEEVNARLFLPFELFFDMSLYYLAMTLAWSVVQIRIEKRMSRGFEPALTGRRRWGLRSALSRSG